MLGVWTRRATGDPVQGYAVTGDHQDTIEGVAWAGGLGQTLQIDYVRRPMFDALWLPRFPDGDPMQPGTVILLSGHRLVSFDPDTVASLYDGPNQQEGATDG